MQSADCSYANIYCFCRSFRYRCVVYKITMDDSASSVVDIAQFLSHSDPGSGISLQKFGQRGCYAKDCVIPCSD